MFVAWIYSLFGVLRMSTGGYPKSLFAYTDTVKLPVIQGVIDRRILVNYRIDPSVLARYLPPPFRPKTHRDMGIGGVCLIRLKNERPIGLPAALGFVSENAAHRFAVKWDQDGETREGVFIPRRDTSSRLSTALGGLLFPGEHHHAKFTVRESDDRFEVAMTSRDGKSKLSVSGKISDSLPESSVFSTVEEASAFFERGSVGYSSTKNPSEFDGLELQTSTWHVEPLEVDLVESSLFDDTSPFPEGTAVFDHALLMRGIEHEWHSLDPIYYKNKSTS